MTFNDLLNNEYFFIIIVLGFLLGMVVLIFALPNMKQNADKKIYGEDDNDEFNVTRLKATIVRKREQTHPVDQTINVKYIVFEFENKQRVELAIKDNDVFATLLEQDEGILSYSNKRFIKFERR